MKVIIGDITEATEPYILHQVNCQNVMGSGVAKALYIKWPQVKSEYHEYCEQHMDRLGRVQGVILGNGQMVFNCFTQDTFGTTGKHTKYWAVAEVFQRIAEVTEDESVAIPYLYGCDLGGGDWNVVSALIEEAFGDRAVIYKLPVS